MSRTYEFLQDRMNYLNKDTFNRYYGMKKYYQFTPKVADIPKLEKYIIKEENDLREMELAEEQNKNNIGRETEER